MRTLPARSYLKWIDYYFCEDERSHVAPFVWLVHCVVFAMSRYGHIKTGVHPSERRNTMPDWWLKAYLHSAATIGGNRCRGDFRLKLESPRAHPPPAGGIIPLSGVPYISTRQVDGMTFPLPTRDRRTGLWLDVLVNWLR